MKGYTERHGERQTNMGRTAPSPPSRGVGAAQELPALVLTPSRPVVGESHPRTGLTFLLPCLLGSSESPTSRLLTSSSHFSVTSHFRKKEPQSMRVGKTLAASSLTATLIVSYRPCALAVPPRRACAMEIKRSEWMSAPSLRNTGLFCTWGAKGESCGHSQTGPS